MFRPGGRGKIDRSDWTPRVIVTVEQHLHVDGVLLGFHGDEKEAEHPVLEGVKSARLSR